LANRRHVAARSPHPDDPPRGSVVLTPTATHLHLQLGEPRGERITFTRNRVELARDGLTLTDELIALSGGRIALSGSRVAL